MMKIGLILGTAALLACSLTGCRSAQPTNSVKQPAPLVVAPVPFTGKPAGGHPGSTSSVTSPIVYVYKTRGDYAHLVPVLMDATRTRIVSYPAPVDLRSGDGLRLPTPLADGYLLDNKGITPHVAFLSYTYEEYSGLSVAPAMSELMAHLLDVHPLVEIHACGRRADYRDQDIVAELNKRITQGNL
ncbi:MAG: hypothetical protein LBM06_06485 [Prevotellaceae bacterium]|jgi:hypothetical protein|nr:hypothetical protein [Prevotellaceae bacterium]